MLSFIPRAIVCALAGALISSARFQNSSPQTEPVPGEPKLLASKNPGGPIRMMHLLTASTGWVLAGDRLFWSVDGGTKWKDITPPLASGQFIDTVFFLNTSEGWVVFSSAPVSELPDIFVASTQDQGRSWTTIRFTAADKFLLAGYGYKAYASFLDPLHGWLLLQQTSGPAYSRGQLFTTSDGGRTWSALLSPPIAGQIRFDSFAKGWLVGGPVGEHLYLTQDGGQHWARETVTPPPEAEDPHLARVESIYSLPSFQDSGRGLLSVKFVLYRGSGTPVTNVLGTYSSPDGGENWQVQSFDRNLPGSATASPVSSRMMLAFHKGNNIVIDNGSGRRSAPPPAGLPADFVIQAMDFVDPLHGWLVVLGVQRAGYTPPTALLATENGGRTITILLQNVPAPWNR